MTAPQKPPPNPRPNDIRVFLQSTKAPLTLIFDEFDRLHDHAAAIRQLFELRGIGVHGAWTLGRELFAWRIFANRRELAAVAGLVPVPHQSGEQDRDRGLTRDGNRYVRGMLIELAWQWLRLQPQSDLARWYQRRFGHGGRRMRKVGIAALARKLLIALWHYVELGVLRDGALLKADT